MTGQQNKLCELMLEFHELCEKKKAVYYLIGPQLLHAAKDGVLHGYEMDVAMLYKDWEKIAKQITPGGNREIESLADHGNLPGCYFRYVDKNTLLLDLDRYGVLAKPGIGINVHIIRIPRKKSKVLTYLEEGLEETHATKRTHPGKLVKVLRTVAHDLFDQKMMRLFITVRARSLDGPTELREPGKHVCTFEPGYWENRTTVKVGGLTLYTVENYQQYLAKRYGRAWAKRQTDAALETFRCIFNTNVPYAKYMALIERDQLVTKKLLSRMNQFKEGNAKYQKLKREENSGWERSMVFSGERFRLWKKYMPLKEQILSLYEAGHLDEVELLLTDYLTVLEKYLKMNMVMCFDSDILDVVKQLYLTYGKKPIVQKINHYVLKEDLLPIRATWRTEVEG